jgi:pyridoxal phosphate enzyme (YggS family)
MLVLKNYLKTRDLVNKININTKIVVVTKNFSLESIKPLIDFGHLDFAENKVQEAKNKWANLIILNPILKLHMIGKVQSNKAKDAFKIFHYIHTLDNEKLAQIFSKLEENSTKKIKYFIQVNVGNEPQKSGISIDKVHQFIKYCINDLKLNIYGLMCIPPDKVDPTQYFISLLKVAKANNLIELSMGMSNDYECAINNGATFVRIGSKIFGDN